MEYETFLNKVRTKKILQKINCFEKIDYYCIINLLIDVEER